MRKSLIFLVLILSKISFGQILKTEANETKIAFGSCGHQEDPLPALDLVVRHKADLFIFLGDNIYGDTDDMVELKKKYGLLASQKSFQNLKKNVPIIATWDDHDFGLNDGGRHYKEKENSKLIFLDFFNEPKTSARRQHEGVYTSYMQTIHGKKLQIILLDVRTFRDDLTLFDPSQPKDNKYFYDLDYTPTLSKDSTLLGQAQWKWLENELKKPADIRLIGTGSQFGIEYNGYEGWPNLPYEKQKFLNIIKETKANGVIFLSGDVHYAEISKLEEPGLYPIYDITASGLSSTWLFATPNKNRIEGPIMENHFGLLTINWQNDPKIKFEIWDETNNQRIEYSIKLSDLHF